MSPLKVLRSSLRQFRQHPLYTFACAVTLALAVGTGTATMALVERAFLDPLPYLGGDALASIYTETQTWPDAPVAAQVVEEIAAGGPVVAVVALEPVGLAYATDRSTRQVLGIEVSPDFFTALATPVLGRPWAADEMEAVVVTHRFWRDELEGDPGAVGRSILLGGVARTVVGVLGPDAVAPYWPQAEAFVPLDMGALIAEQPRTPDLTVVARLADGATVDRLNAWLDGYTERSRAAYPELHARERWWAESLRTELVGAARPVLLATGLAAALLLLIVCANIAGLSSVQAVGLRQRLAIQGALGATRRRLVLERIGQSAAVAAVGSAAGVWLAQALVGMTAAFQSHFMQRMSAVVLDTGTAAAGFGLGVAAGVVSAVVPVGAVIAGRLDPLPSARGSTAGRDLSLVRSGLVVMQVALALVLIVGAGLLVRTLRTLTETHLGHRTEGLYTLSLNLPGERYATTGAQIAFEDRVVDELSRLPGALGASSSIGMPVVGGMRAPVTIAGRGRENGTGEVAYMSLAPGFMDVWEMRLLEGRGFAATDVIGGPGAIVINETMARRYWPEGDAVGARLWIGGGGGPGEGEEWMTVVGVVADVRQHGPTEAVLPTAFGSTRQYSWAWRNFTVRTAEGAPGPTAEALRAVIHRVDPTVPVAQIQRVDEMVAMDTGRHRLATLALTFFGAVATILAALGLYAVVSLSSRLRRREYAIRLAVGAEPDRVRGLVVRQGLALGALGAAVGLALAGAGTRALQGLLVGVTALDPATFLLAAAAVIVLALAAAWGPARAAGRTQPVEILNAD